MILRYREERCYDRQGAGTIHMPDDNNAEGYHATIRTWIGLYQLLGQADEETNVFANMA